MFEVQMLSSQMEFHIDCIRHESHIKLRQALQRMQLNVRFVIDRWKDATRLPRTLEAFCREQCVFFALIVFARSPGTVHL